MSGILKSLGKIALVALGVAAVVFTAGAAIPAIGAIVGTGGLTGAMGGLLGSIGIEATSTLGTVLVGAASGAASGAALGAVKAAVTGEDIFKGMGEGAEMGALTGGVMNGIGAATAAGGATVQAPDVASEVNTGTISSATPSIAADGIANSGVAGADLTGATAGVTPVTTATLPGVADAGSAANGAGGLLAQGPGTAPYTPASASVGAAGSAAPPLPDFVTPQAPDATLPTYDVANPAASPALASNPVDGPSTASNGAAQGGGGLMSFLGKNGPLGNGGLGYVLGGVGSALVEGQSQTDQIKATAKLAQDSRAATTANYGQSTPTGGGLLTPAAQQPGLRAPTQAFNPTSRWVYDPNQKKLVLVPSATS